MGDYVPVILSSFVVNQFSARKELLVFGLSVVINFLCTGYWLKFYNDGKVKYMFFPLYTQNGDGADNFRSLAESSTNFIQAKAARGFQSLSKIMPISEPKKEHAYFGKDGGLGPLPQYLGQLDVSINFVFCTNLQLQSKE